MINTETRYKVSYSTHQPIREDISLSFSDHEQILTNHDFGCARIFPALHRLHSSSPLRAVAGFPTFGTGDIVSSVFLCRGANASSCFIKNRFQNSRMLYSCLNLKDSKTFFRLQTSDFRLFSQELYVNLYYLLSFTNNVDLLMPYSLLQLAGCDC